MSTPPTLGDGDVFVGVCVHACMHMSRWCSAIKLQHGTWHGLQFLTVHLLWSTILCWLHVYVVNGAILGIPPWVALLSGSHFSPDYQGLEVVCWFQFKINYMVKAKKKRDAMSQSLCDRLERPDLNAFFLTFFFSEQQTCQI